MIVLLLLFGGLVLVRKHATAQTVYVPLSHWVYDFVERMETKGLLTHGTLGTKPFTRSEVAEYLKALLDTTGKEPYINSVEEDQLAYLINEFREELEQVTTLSQARRPLGWRKLTKSRFLDKALPDKLYENDRNLLSWKSNNFSVYWDPLFVRDALFAEADTLDWSEQIYQNTNGFRFWGTLGEHIGFLCDVRDTKEWGTREYPTRFMVTAERLGFVNGYGDHIYHDETVAYVTLRWPWLTLQFGKDSNRWGPGYHGSLALSDYSTSYDQLKLQTRYWRLKFTALTAFLRHYPPVRLNGEQRDRTLAAHRLEIDVARWLDIGVHETVIYSDRKLEPAYLNPVMFFRSAEHFLGDRDNVGMGFDFKAMFIPRTKLYGEMFIDDISTTKLGTGWYGNKYAYLCGVHLVDLFGLDNLDVRIEYARIRPFVYTHKDSLNVYKHFSTALGYFSGPNSDNFFVEIAYRFSQKLGVNSFFDINRHGADEPDRIVGGDIDTPHLRGRDAEYVSFLDGLRTTSSRLAAQIDWEPLRGCIFSVRGGLVWFRQQLSPSQDEKGSRQEITLRFALNEF